jgi:hypothetical protein
VAALKKAWLRGRRRGCAGGGTAALARDGEEAARVRGTVAVSGGLRKEKGQMYG